MHGHEHRQRDHNFRSGRPWKTTRLPCAATLASGAGSSRTSTPTHAVDDQRLRIAAAEQDPKHPILVAELRNWIAGWVELAPYDNRIALDDIGEVYIYVRRAFRSYGVGRQLMRAIQESAGKLGYRKLIGRVLAQNQDGLAMCRATGWRDVGRHSAHARLNDGLHDVMLVEYLIPSSPPQQP